VSGHDPREDYDDEPGLGRLAPEQVVRLPASAMWVFGLLQLVGTQLWVGFVAILLLLVELVDHGKPLDDVWDKIEDEPIYWATLLAWPVATACGLFVMRGANDLRRFRHYWRVVAAVVLTLFSVPVVCVGVFQLPIGVWILLVVTRRDVRARFEAVARGTMEQTSEA
jgi:hypothetical protein